MIRVLLSLYVVLFLALPAEAAPLGAAIAAVSSWWAGASALVKLGVVLALNVGTGLLDQYRAKKAARKANEQGRGVTLQMQMGDTLSRSYLIGTRPTAGRRTYGGSWGDDGKTPNAYLVDVREISCLPSHAGPYGLQALRVADRYVTILWGEPDPEGRGYPVQEYRVNGRDHCWVHYLDGAQTIAHPYLRAKFGSHATHPWKSTMIGRGCQAVIVTLRRNDEVFTSGLPEMLFRPSPMRLYNLCKDGSKGGSGAHRWDDQSTWEPSDNLAVMAYNVARGIYHDGRWVHGGRNFAHHRLPASSWMAAITEAERDMGGGRRQFRGGLEVRVEESGLSILEKFRAGCAGRFAEIGGSLKMLVGAPAAAVWTMTDETIVVTRDQDYEPFPSTKARINTIRPTYPEPAIGWRDKDGKARSSAALLERDGGEELAIDVNLDVVSDAAQVDAISATMIEEAQRWRKHRQVLPPSARPLEPNDVIAYTSERNSYANKKFIISQIRRLTGCLWEVTYQELDPSDYDPPSGYLPPVIGPTGPIPVPAQAADGFTAVAASVDDGAGTARRPAVRVGCPDDLDDIAAVHVKIEVKDTGLVIYDNAANTLYPRPGPDAVYSWLLSGEWAVPGLHVLVRGRLVPISVRPTEWSDPIEVLLPDIRLTLSDLAAEVVSSLEALRDWIDNDTIDNLVQQAEEQAEALGQEQAQRVAGAIEASDRYRSLVDEVAALRDRAMDLDLAGYAARQEIKRQLTVSIEGYAASFDERITVAASNVASVAQRATALEASTVTLGAQIATVDTARIEGEEALAQQIALLTAGNLNQFDQAVDWYFDATVEGWGGNGAPTATGGWLRPADHATLPYVVSPAVSVSGTRYSQVRGRIRRTGTPAWRGQLWWQTTTEATWDVARRVTVAEPIWDTAGNADLTFNADWSGTITAIRLDLTTAQAGGSAVEIDWVAIGRPSPGASAAALAAERQARIDADAAAAADIVGLKARATDLETGVSGIASGVSALETMVSTLGDAVTATGSVLDALALEVDDKAEADVVNAMSAEITALGTGLTNQGGMVTAIRSSLLPAAMEMVDQDFAGFFARRKGAVALSEASQALNNRVDLTAASLSVVAEAVIQVQAIIPDLAASGAMTALAGRVTVTEGSITANTTAINAINAALPGKAGVSALNELEGRVTTAEGNISANASAITSINAALPGKAGVSAVNSLSAIVGSQGDTIEAHGSWLAGLEADVGSISAQARLKAEVVAGAAGYSRIGLFGRSGTWEGFREGGLWLNVPVNPALPVEVLVEASRFAVVNGATKKVPFVVDTDRIYLSADVYIERAIIGDLIVNTHNIAPGATVAARADVAGEVPVNVSTWATLIILDLPHGEASCKVKIDYASQYTGGNTIRYRIQDLTSNSTIFSRDYFGGGIANISNFTIHVPPARENTVYALQILGIGGAMISSTSSFAAVAFKQAG